MPRCFKIISLPGRHEINLTTAITSSILEHIAASLTARTPHRIYISLEALSAFSRGINFPTQLAAAIENNKIQTATQSVNYFDFLLCRINLANYPYNESECGKRRAPISSTSVRFGLWPLLAWREHLFAAKIASRAEKKELDVCQMEFCGFCRANRLSLDRRREIAAHMRTRVCVRMEIRAVGVEDALFESVIAASGATERMQSVVRHEDKEHKILIHPDRLREKQNRERILRRASNEFIMIPLIILFFLLLKYASHIPRDAFWGDLHALLRAESWAFRSRLYLGWFQKGNLEDAVCEIKALLKWVLFYICDDDRGSERVIWMLLWLVICGFKKWSGNTFDAACWMVWLLSVSLEMVASCVFSVLALSLNGFKCWSQKSYWVNEIWTINWDGHRYILMFWY